ncbi:MULTISPECIES: DNA primase [Cellulomonas]|uniref:DNA primase n=1 Tax=Cellulomonas iranensis TaxID=76862 RepID=A0ABU0GQ50_9CELL|nr:MULTISPECIES: DNA primase [Cellulomonas]MDQ0426697.1 DNA primase [Cellulomonas iranensis]TFH74327.1 DNA primase [Cellulomonas sp. HD19AZ1]
MAGRIRREDVEAVRERVRIEDVVGAHVALRPAGVGSLKGLCPFHDERTPSFHVRPQVGRYHCFGCGEGGDVIAFVQAVDGLGFTDAVEYLASRVGLQVRYEDGGPTRPGEEPGRRRRLLDAHRVAEEFYREQLVTPQAAAARAFLSERGFDRTAAETFGVGYAPQGWDALLRHLRGRGFTEAELTASGLVSQGQRGVYDRFRGRLVWPIREVTGDTVGFGARRLYDEDNGPKYLNTPETPLYRKSHVLYGIDLAKREIAKAKQVVVVEGYTDVMAMHLSGVPTAVATCGTAFGSDHSRIVRRLVGDAGGAGGVQLAGGSSVGGEIVFTFDGDAAGQKAALRAFGEDQAFSAQTFVAVEPSGMDPCELRQARGPDAVRALVSTRQPLFAFVIRSTLAAHDLTTAEGRVGALRAAAPVVAGIRDSALRPEYERLLAGWLGMDDVAAVRRAVSDASRRGARPGARPGPERDARRPVAGDAAPAPVPVARMTAPDRRDPVAQVERTALEVVLQHPTLVPPDFDALAPDACTAPAYRAVHEAVRAAGGVSAAADLVARGGEAAWVGAVLEEAAEPVRPLLTEMSVAPLPEDRPESLPGYVRGVVMRLVDIGYTRRIADVRGRLQRLDAAADAGEQRALLGELLELEARRRSLRESA